MLKEIINFSCLNFLKEHIFFTSSLQTKKAIELPSSPLFPYSLSIHQPTSFELRVQR